MLEFRLIQTWLLLTCMHSKDRRPLLTPATQVMFGRYELLLKDQNCVLYITQKIRTNNPSKRKKSLKVQNFEVVNSAICAIFTLCHCKNLAAEC